MISPSLFLDGARQTGSNLLKTWQRVKRKVKPLSHPGKLQGKAGVGQSHVLDILSPSWVLLQVPQSLIAPYSALFKMCIINWKDKARIAKKVTQLSAPI